MRQRSLTVCRWILGALVLFTVLFIWSNSLQNGEVSGERSGFFRDFLQQHFDITQEPFRFLYDYVRKIGHFVEFALLGAEVAALAAVGRKQGLWRSIGAFAFCVAIAAMDEGIQRFVPGRVAAVTDVCLDAAGALFGMLCFWCCACLARRLFKKK